MKIYAFKQKRVQKEFIQIQLHFNISYINNKKTKLWFFIYQNQSMDGRYESHLNRF